MPFEGFLKKPPAPKPEIPAVQEGLAEQFTDEELSVMEKILEQAPVVEKKKERVVPDMAGENLHPVKGVEHKMERRKDVSNPHGFTELK